MHELARYSGYVKFLYFALWKRNRTVPLTLIYLRQSLKDTAKETSFPASAVCSVCVSKKASKKTFVSLFVRCLSTDEY